MSGNKPTAQFVEQVVEYEDMNPSRRNKSQMAATPITLNSIEGTQEETKADYQNLWRAEKERADQLQNQVRALEAEVGRLQPGVAEIEAAVVEIAPTTEERQNGGHAMLSS